MLYQEWATGGMFGDQAFECHAVTKKHARCRFWHLQKRGGTASEIAPCSAFWVNWGEGGLLTVVAYTKYHDQIDARRRIGGGNRVPWQTRPRASMAREMHVLIRTTLKGILVHDAWHQYLPAGGCTRALWLCVINTHSFRFLCIRLAARGKNFSQQHPCRRQSRIVQAVHRRAQTWCATTPQTYGRY
jgi:hypothetical protein